MHTNNPEAEELERVAEWRLRLVDADAGDHDSVRAAALLERLAGDLRQNPYPALWAELGAIGNWLAESDGISDFADLATDFRLRIGVSEHPVDGAAYLQVLLAIARSLV